MHKDHQILSFRTFGFVLLALGFVSSSTPAEAGFQWIAPMPDAPVVTGAAPSEALPPPQVIEAQTPLPPIKGLEEKKLPVGIAQDKPVRGFADNIPLSVALRQILPQEIGFSVAQDVSLGTLVSWKGGAAWRPIMKDMLAPAGLTFQEQGQLIHVVHSGDKPMAMTPSSPFSHPSVSPSDAGKPMALLPPIDLAGKTPAQLPAGKPQETGGVGGFLSPSSIPSSPSVVTPASSVQDKMVDTWSANKGDTLQKVLEEWCRRANVEMNWQAEYDYPLQASVSFASSFEDAVRNLLLGFQDAQPQPVGFLHNSQTAGQTVLVVQVRGNNYNE